MTGDHSTSAAEPLTAGRADRPIEGRCRTVIEGVSPEIDGGRFPIKRVVGEQVTVETDAFADGHDVVVSLLLYRKEDEQRWRARPMQPIGNDRWRAAFRVDAVGCYYYTVTAWVDHFLSWRHDFARRVEAEDIRLAARVGAGLIVATAQRATGEHRQHLSQWSARLAAGGDPQSLKDEALREDLAAIASRYPDRRFSTVYRRELAVIVDRERARFSAWYEMFPRSCSEVPERHGTFADCEARLSYVADMGFDVAYLPPIHPIGATFRKGRNNALEADGSDVGSPWAIGATEGGHKAMHPDLGAPDDFRRLVAKARSLGIEIALDIAYQCSPDHPYLREHPEWFRWRPDATVQYAENPPKKYQDIYPFNFESDQWQGLWTELKSVLLHWIGEGVRIFRVDNPHTKPFPFWEWAIAEIRREHPDVIFLSEAFTRPKIMHRLAKLGFTQSYTYFAWRNTKEEIQEYFSELCQSPSREYFRPNCWPNTPDILTEYLQFGGRAAFMIRLALAATLSANYGIYGPAFELLERTPREPGSEEYMNAEKYERRIWELNREDSLKDFIARVNRARRDNPALQHDWSLKFFPVDNEQIICYAKATEDLSNIVVVVVNLDPHHTQSGWVEIDLQALRVDPHAPYQMHDLLTGARYLWSGPRNYVQLDPTHLPAHLFRVRRRTHTERDFDYYM